MGKLRAAALSGIAAIAVLAMMGTAMAQSIDVPTIVDATGAAMDEPAPIAEQFGNQMHWGLHYAGIVPHVIDDLPEVMDIATYDYVMEEYFIEGTAGTLENGDPAPYSSRFVVLRPSNIANFSGMMLIETQHPGAGIFQTASYARVGGMMAGHMFVGVTNTQDQLGGGTHVSSVNAPRYAGLSIEGGEGAQNPIIAQVAALMQLDNPLGEEWVPEWVVMTGASATSRTAVNFMTQPNGNTAPENALPGGDAPVDAMFVWDNVGFADTNEEGEDIRDTHLDGPLAGVPSIVMATQLEWDADYTVANQDMRSDDTELYRLYQVPGMPHIGTRYLSDANACDLQPMSRFMTEAYVYLGVERMYEWLANDVDPGNARVEFDDGGYVRDEHGNAVGGVRSPQVDVPTVAFMSPNAGGVGPCNLAGYDEPFDEATLDDLYPGGKADYSRQVWARALELIDEGWFPAESIWDLQAEIEGYGETWVSPVLR